MPSFQTYPLQQYVNIKDTVVFEILSDGTLVLTNGITISTGSGSPNGVIVAPVGSLYIQIDGISPNILWQKQIGSDSGGWSVAIGSGGGGGGGNVNNSGTPLTHQVPIWVDATHILGITPGTAGLVLTSNGVGSDPSFQAGGNVNNSGTPLNHQVALWIDATHVQGLTPSTAGFILTSNGVGADPSFQANPFSLLGQNIINNFPGPPDTVTPSNSSAFPGGASIWNSFNPSGVGPSSIQQLPHNEILVPCSTWKMALWQPTGTATESFKMQIYRMAIGSVTIQAVANITFGGLSSPSFSSPGTILTSDAISFAIDTAHDYYIVFDAISGLPAIGGSGGPLTAGVYISGVENYGLTIGSSLNFTGGSPQSTKSLIISWKAQS